MNCIICGEPAGFLSIKLQNGKICKNCASKLPSLMTKGRPCLQEYAIKQAIKYVEDNMKKFCATASYGKLHIDSIHGLFAIANRLDKDGKPKTGNNVFSIYNLSEVGVVCKSPRADHNNVIVDVEFRCSIEDPYISFSVPIKRSVRCQIKQIGIRSVEWDEPGDLAMFRSMFNQMVLGAFEKVNSMLCGKTVHAFEIEKARAIFMLTDDYTEEELKKARRLMMKVYHPDKGENVEREAKIINDAYDLLKSELERGKSK